MTGFRPWAAKWLSTVRVRSGSHAASVPRARPASASDAADRRPTLAGAQQLALLSDQMVALTDVGSVSSASRREVGIETATYLMDIFGRIEPPAPESVPDEAALEREGTESHRIAGTPLRIARMSEGDREGEYLALALRPTLENLVGGVMLYIDRPVRVGDFCSFGDQQGTVEGTGIRSTKLRALDRTLISVPARTSFCASTTS